jgi:hypothetical protein
MCMFKRISKTILIEFKRSVAQILKLTRKSDDYFGRN